MKTSTVSSRSSRCHRESRIEPLECRIAPATVTFSGTSGNDSITVELDGIGGIDVTVNGSTTNVPIAGTTQLALFGLGGNDLLTVDSSNGLIDLPEGIVFDGGAGLDSLVLSGGGTQTDDSLVVGGTSDAGESIIVGPGGTQQVTFSGLEEVSDVVPVTTFHLTGAANINSLLRGDNAISYQNSQIVPNGARITVDAFAPIEFLNKTSLIIEGGAGDDTIVTNHPGAPTGLADITINGADPGDADRVVINSRVNVTEFLQVSQNGLGAIVTGGAVPITVTGMSSMSLVGQATENDRFAYNGTAGADTFIVTPGPTRDTGSVTGFGPNFTFVPMQWSGFTGYSSFPLVGPADTMIVNGTAGSDTFAVAKSAVNGDLALVVNNGTEIHSGGGKWILRGLGSDDTFDVTYNQTLGAPAQLEIEGGGSGTGDTLRVHGTDTVPENFAYQMAGTSGQGEITVNTGPTTDYSGIGRVFLEANPTENDTLSITGPAGDRTWDVGAGGNGDLVQISGREAVEYDGFNFVQLTGASGTDVFRVQPTRMTGFITSFKITGDAALPATDRIEFLGTTAADNISATFNSIGVNGVDVAVGSGIVDVSVSGLAGNDNLDLGSFSITRTTIFGGDGDDDITGGTLQDTVFGGAGNDQLSGGLADDTLYGEEGNDTLAGNQGADQLFGGGGSDTFQINAGDASDTVEGDEGTDVLSFLGSSVGEHFVFVQNGARLALSRDDGAVATTSMGSIEQVDLDTAGGDDSIVINDLRNTGVRRLSIDVGGTALETADIDIFGTGSGDVIDVAVFTDPADAADKLRVDGLAYEILLSSMETVDSIIGDSLLIRGAQGNDFLKAEPGVDGIGANHALIILDGGAGDDTLSADATLLGGAGNDTLIGGLGNDAFDGGAGTDRVLAAGDVNFTLTDTTLTGLGSDTLTGIEQVELTGGVGANRFDVGAFTGFVKIAGTKGSDTLDLSAATVGANFDLDLLHTNQTVNSLGLTIALDDAIENFLGTSLNDVLRVDAATFARNVVGGPHGLVPPGDRLLFDGQGAVVQVQKTDSNTGTVKTLGYADVTFDEFETTDVSNSPSGSGSFGTPGNSTVFSTAHIYDNTLFVNGTKRVPGMTPSAVATGDLNGDGFADMVVVNSKTSNISVLINKGNGTFLDPVNISTVTTGPQDLVIADFDSDTKLDVVVSHPAAGKISFFKGDGTGGFTAPNAFVTPKFKPFALAVGDMNGDTKPDLVATSRDTSAVEVMLGNGGGFFALTTPVKTVGTQPVDVVVADFNGDNKLDVVTANALSNNISLLPGLGSGALGNAIRFAAGARPSSLAVGDLDNDGKLDLAVSNTSSRFVSVFLGRGNVAPASQFAPQLRVALPGNHQASSIVIADFDNDGIADLGLGNRLGTNFTVLRGIGAAAYTQPFEIDLGKDPKFAVTGAIAATDLNNDGLIDVIATSLASHDVRVLLRKV